MGEGERETSIVVHEHAMRERVITWHFIILINVPKVSSSFLGGIVLGKLPQLREALGTLREGRILVYHCVQGWCSTHPKSYLYQQRTLALTNWLKMPGNSSVRAGRGEEHTTSWILMRVATRHTVNLRFSSQFPLMAKVFADREAWTAEGGKQSYILPSHMESENELTFWVSEVKHVAIIFDHVHLKQTQGVYIPSSTLLWDLDTFQLSYLQIK